MRRNKPVISRILLILGVMASSTSLSEPVAVISHEGVQLASLTREDVADLFLGKRKMVVAGLALTPVDVSDDALRETFYQQVAGMSAIRVNAYWARQVFSAKGRPPIKLPLADAKSMVLAQPGMVTYVPDKNASEFKVLLRLP